MEIYVARQPIFDSNKNVVAYELLHRQAGETQYAQQDGNYASSSVIAGNFLSLGLDSLTSGKQAFINFTAELLTSGVATILPKDQLVIELLETIEPTEQIVSTCKELSSEGYQLALDDFVMQPGYEELLRFVNIVKVDFLATTPQQQKGIVVRWKRDGLRFLAEKVETDADFKRAVACGYTLFQGYFFAKPVLLAANAVPVSKLGYLQLMTALNQKNPDFRQIASAIESDVAISLETIKLVNSAFYGKKQRIRPIHQAVVSLGMEGVRKWIYLSALRKLVSKKPDILISNSLIRSRFMELLSEQNGAQSRMSEYALLGLFSLLDTITNCSFPLLLKDLNISDDIKAVLMYGQQDSHIGKAFQLMLAYEKGDWQSAQTLCSELGISIESVSEAYLNSLAWYNKEMLPLMA